MRSLALLLCLISVVNGLINGNSSCVNDTAKNEYPFLVRIMYEKALICGGTIINNQYILTSAECVYEREPEDLLVVVGTNSAYEGGVRHLVGEVHWHHKFKAIRINNNIGLLRVTENIKFNSRIQPITLSSSNNFPAGETATLIGWDAEMCMAGEREQEILPQENCTNPCRICTLNKVYSWFGVPCYSVIGNPLTLNSIQIGVSSGDAFCIDVSDTFTVVGLHMDWIKKRAGRITVSAGSQVYPNIVLSHAILMLVSYSYSRL